MSYSNFFTTNIDYPSFGLTVPLFYVMNMTLTQLDAIIGLSAPALYNFKTLTTSTTGWANAPYAD